MPTGKARTGQASLACPELSASPDIVILLCRMSSESIDRALIPLQNLICQLLATMTHANHAVLRTIPPRGQSKAGSIIQM